MPKTVYALTLILTLIGSSFAIAQIPLPIGVGGLITVDDIPVGGITVQVENLNTGEVKTTTTAYDTPYTKCGYYTVALTGQNGDVIKVTVTYGDTYSNTTTVDLVLVTQYCNISISTEEPYNPPDDPLPSDDDDVSPDDDDEKPPSSEDNETDENDTDNDIRSQYNLTVTVFGNTTEPIGNASVTIFCNDIKIAKSYTNDTGLAMFVLEEDEYTIEVTKSGYNMGTRTVSLLCSTEYTFCMNKSIENSNPDSQSQDDDQATPWFLYAMVAAAVSVILVVSVLVWRHYK